MARKLVLSMRMEQSLWEVLREPDSGVRSSRSTSRLSSGLQTVEQFSSVPLMVLSMSTTMLETSTTQLRFNALEASREQRCHSLELSGMITTSKVSLMRILLKMLHASALPISAEDFNS